MFRILLCVGFARNSATESIAQRLVFVGKEEGKLLAIRQLVKDVRDLAG
jgi:hypothetical protein